MIFKLLSILLRYPDEEVLAARPDMAEAVLGLPASPAKSLMLDFVGGWEESDPYRLQKEYIATFDFNRRGNLYLTYYRHGDSRLRGEALLEVKEAYARAGYELSTAELPDYLPLVLEFASEAPAEGGRLLSAHRGTLEVIRRSLHKDESPHALLLDALCELLPDLDASEVDELRNIIMHGPPSETVGLEPYGAENPQKPPSQIVEIGRRRR